MRFIVLFREGPRSINYEAYFVAIAKNCLIDELRKVRGTVPFDDVFEVVTPGVDPRARTEAKLELLLALEKLDARCRFAIQAHYIRGIPAVDLARHLGVEEESVHMVMRRCREALARVLGRSR
jgi:RNA polymerase sigma factor (sigma-70 family)